MEFERTEIADVILIKPRVFGDERGFFMETYRESLFAEHGISTRFVQDNCSKSSKAILRGLHYQIENPQAKLVSVMEGEVFDVAVDVRKGSPTFGKWVGRRLSAENKHMLFIPEGFAHGFYVMSESTLFTYKCSDYWNKDGERGLIWNDPSVGIEWPGMNAEPILSEKDAANPALGDIPDVDLPAYQAKGE